MNSSLIEDRLVHARAGEDNDYCFLYAGPSMSPLLKSGDLLRVKKSTLVEIHLGDVVVIARGGRENCVEYVVHRVVSVGEKQLVTQGDNNFKLDACAVTNENLVGMVISFDRQNRIHLVKGGQLGFWYGRVILMRNHMWRLSKHIGWWIYHLIRQSGLIARIWRPVINRIKVNTDTGPLVKYCYGKYTVARWWPEIKKYDVVKPFDLVIPHPEESK